MKENQPSVTAQRVAMLRALHQLLDNPKVFDDPVSLRIIGKEDALALRTDPHQYDEANVLSPIETRILTCCTCLKLITQRHRSGTACLEKVCIALPCDFTFVPIDFGSQTLSERLCCAGYDQGIREMADNASPNSLTGYRNMGFKKVGNEKVIMVFVLHPWN